MSEEPAEPLNKPERELQYFSDWNLGIGWVAGSDSVRCRERLACRKNAGYASGGD